METTKRSVVSMAGAGGDEKECFLFKNTLSFGRKRAQITFRIVKILCMILNDRHMSLYFYPNP